MKTSEHSFNEIRKRSKNQLLMPTEVGCAKGSVRDLPSPEHRYGYQQKKDREGAGALLSSWQLHKPTVEAVSQKDYRKLNKLGAVSQITKPKQVKEFREKHNFVIKSSKNNLKHSKDLPGEEFIYGIPSKPSMPIQKLIEFEYGNKAAEETHNGYLEVARGKSREFRSFDGRSLQTSKSIKGRRIGSTKTYGSVKRKIKL